MMDEIGKSEKKLPKTLNSLSQNSIRDDHNSPNAEIMPDGENTISVQFASDGLDSDQENFDPNDRGK